MSDTQTLYEGDVIEIKAGHTVYARLPAHFVYRDRVGVFDETAETEVVVGADKNGLDTRFLIGRYIVDKAYFAGGSESIANGWKVHCKHPEYPIEISFYQTGCFTAMINDIKPIGKAKKTWTLDD